MMRPCVTTKARKIGVSTMTDSLIPLKFSVIRNSKQKRVAINFQGPKNGGKKLKMASTLAAMEMATVKT